MQQLAVLLKSEAIKNLALGIGAIVLVPLAVKALAPVLRPLARSTLKVGILAYEKGRETVAELGEVVDDLVAEVHEEMQEARERENELLAGEGGADRPLASASEKR